jgi:hypothetical protein
MRNYPREIRHALRADPILAAVLGEDKDGEVKVYTPLVKTGVEAPYLTFQIVPTFAPISAYGDHEVIEAFQISVTSWSSTNMEAWSLADITDDALKRADYDFDPYRLMHVLRTSTPFDLVDRESKLFYLAVQYQFALGR